MNTNEKDYNLRTIGTPSIPNLRKLGGYKNKDGKVIANLLFRSSKLSTATDEDLLKLEKEYNIGYVIDFRSEVEIIRDPDRLPNNAKLIPIDILQLKFPEEEKNMDRTTLILKLLKSGRAASLYDDLLFSEICIKGYRQFFDVLLNNSDKKGILWHCSEGKDRTGIAAALIMYILDVDNETIVHDYDLSNVPYVSRVEKMKIIAEQYKLEKPLADVLISFGGVDPKCLISTMEKAIANYGSIDQYLKEVLFIGKDEKAALKQLYLI